MKNKQMLDVKHTHPTKLSVILCQLHDTMKKHQLMSDTLATLYILIYSQRNGKWADDAYSVVSHILHVCSKHASPFERICLLELSHRWKMFMFSSTFPCFTLRSARSFHFTFGSTYHSTFFHPSSNYDVINSSIKPKHVIIRYNNINNNLDKQHFFFCFSPFFRLFLHFFSSFH